MLTFGTLRSAAVDPVSAGPPFYTVKTGAEGRQSTATACVAFRVCRETLRSLSLLSLTRRDFRPMVFTWRFRSVSLLKTTLCVVAMECFWSVGYWDFLLYVCVIALLFTAFRRVAFFFSFHFCWSFTCLRLFSKLRCPEYYNEYAKLKSQNGGQFSSPSRSVTDFYPNCHQRGMCVCEDVPCPALDASKALSSLLT